MNNNLKNRSNLSRREFIRTCGLSTGAIAAAHILGGFTWKNLAMPKTGPARYTYALNQNWLFGGKYSEGSLNPKFNDSSFSKINLPHSVAKLSWQNWNPDEWQDVWTYRRYFNLPEGSKDKRIFLNFDGVMVGARPVINGHVLPEHLGGYLPFCYEITKWTQEKSNLIAVAVDSRWDNVPPTGNLKKVTEVDFLLPGGIHRPVNITVVPQIFIEDVFAEPINVLDSSRSIKITCSIDASVKPTKLIQVRTEILRDNKIISSTEGDFKISKVGETEIVLNLTKLGNVKLWDVNDPKLYDIVVTLMIEGKPIHDYRTRVGLRDARFELGGFYLNGKRTQIFGLCRHELYPYVGYAMPERIIHRDAEIIKHELNCNMVRCSHYPQNETFFDACDEFGLLVWEEIPAWGYIGDETWQKLVLRDVRDMVVRDRNHPSIIIWGVRGNETENNPELWGTSKAIAKALDPSKQTTGAMLGRFDSTKNWVQDVFARNDYSCNRRTGVMKLKKPVPKVPFMLSEGVGQVVGIGPTSEHVYNRIGDPTLQAKQAIYHAQAHDQAAEYKQTAGLVAWCAFEYASLNKNAYKGVKYPGVVDFFRIPKTGASFYQAQVSPKVRPVIKPNFYWDFGSKMPNGPGKNVAVFSNCEKLKFFIDKKLHATVEPDFKNYPHIKYPPFFVDLEIDGRDKSELRIEGYIAGKLVLTKQYSSDTSKDQFYLKVDDKELVGDGIDATRLEFKVVDKFGESRLFGKGKVTLEIKGPGTVVGDNPFELAKSGGAGAVWVKTVPYDSGIIKIKASHSFLGTKFVEIKVSSDKGTVKI